MTLSSQFFKSTVIGLAALLTAGCGSSWFSQRDEDPIVKDLIRKGVITENVGATLGTRSERRLAFFNMTNNQLKICAEPSPDATEEVARKLAAAMSAQVQGSGSGQVSIDSEMLRKAMPVFERTQGLQLMRDAFFQSCLAHMNKSIDNAALDKRFYAILELAGKLIDKELEQRSSDKKQTDPAPVQP